MVDWQDRSAESVAGLQQQVEMLRYMLREAIEAKASAEAALTAQQIKYDDLTHRVPWAVLRVRSDGHYADVNSYFADLLGRDARDIIDRRVGSLNEPEDWVRLILQERETERAEVTFTVGGAERRFLVLKFLCRRGGHTSVIALDQTDRASFLEEARRQAERADAANRAKSRFLAVMSHEIRTPMNGLLGMATLLEETDLNPDQRDRLSVIVSSGHALLGIINDVLDLEKIEAGGIDLERKAFSPGKLFEEVGHLFAARASEKGVALSVKLHRGVPSEVVGDPLRLRQVVSNLVGNAVKFTSAGQVDVEVEGAVEDGRWLMKATVTDTGIGVESSKIAMLFQPFAQADSSTARQYGGSGLGLNIAKGLVEAMGGSISVQSRVGHGSCFTLCVPFEIVEGMTALKDAPRLKREHVRGALRGLRVMVAEDNLVNRRVARGMLELLGCEVTCVADGQQAVDLMSVNAAFDIILMDMEMPVMDGVAATGAIRRMRQGTSIPILAVTANAMIEQRDLCLEAGMTDYMSKPFTTEQLYAAILQNSEAARNCHEGLR